MSSTYPGSLDNFATDKTNSSATENDHPAHHNDLADAVNKIEAELGVNPAGSFDTVAERLGAGLAGYDIAERTSGNLTIASATGVELHADFRLSVPASAGDLLMIGVSFMLDIATALEFTMFDVATIVSATPVNWVSGSSDGLTSGLGVLAWFCDSDEPQFHNVGGMVPYVVDADDISGGAVELHFYYRHNTAGNRNFRSGGGGDGVAKTFVNNLGQP